VLEKRRRGRYKKTTGNTYGKGKERKRSDTQRAGKKKGAMIKWNGGRKKKKPNVGGKGAHRSEREVHKWGGSTVVVTGDARPE